MTKRIFVCVAAVLGMVWTASANIPVSDQLTVYNPAGGVLYQLTVLEDGTYFGSPGTPVACFYGPCGSAGLAEDPMNVYYINVPGLALQSWEHPTVLTEGGGTDSDAFGVTSGTDNSFYLGFQSDNELVGITGVQFDPIYVPEFTGVYPGNATQYLNPNFAGYTATFTSEPEPGVLGLLALQLGLVGVLIRRCRFGR
jgi:hypothetical protein